MRKFLTLIRRELWEHKTGFIVLPIICTLILSLLLSIGYLRFAPPPTNTISSPPLLRIPAQISINNFQHLTICPSINYPYLARLTCLILPQVFRLFAGCGCRCARNFIAHSHTQLCPPSAVRRPKNREILFWRSMPVSETENLLAKLAMIYGLAPSWS